MDRHQFFRLSLQQGEVVVDHILVQAVLMQAAVLAVLVEEEVLENRVFRGQPEVEIHLLQRLAKGLLAGVVDIVLALITVEEEAVQVR